MQDHVQAVVELILFIGNPIVESWSGRAAGRSRRQNQHQGNVVPEVLEMGSHQIASRAEITSPPAETCNFTVHENNSASSIQQLQGEKFTSDFL
jgi:hypothetical protein